MIIAIDFDETIVHSDVFKIKGLVDDAPRVIRKLYDAGHIIIIWTCREGVTKEDAKNTLWNHKIPYHYINENVPGQSVLYGVDCRKIGADVYIDDKNLYGFPGWLAVEKYFFDLLDVPINV